jgi:hypothetical protein
MINTAKKNISKSKLHRLLASLMLVTVFISNGISANTAISNDKCFEDIKLEANFIAFTTKKNSSLADWYQHLFGLNTVKEFAFPDGKTTGVLMHKDDFVIEVFFKEDILRGKALLPQSSTEQWQGVNKVGIFTNANLPTLKECLGRIGVNAGRIWQDKNLPIHLLQVTDPDGNVLEIISRSNSTDTIN